MSESNFRLFPSHYSPNKTHNTIYFLLNHFKCRTIEKSKKIIVFFRGGQPNEFQETHCMGNLGKKNALIKYFFLIQRCIFYLLPNTVS